MESNAQKRSDQLDIVKALGIIAVVYGHSLAPFSIFVSLYHLALFFFVSGYLYKERYARDPLTLVKKRLWSLYVPFVGFGLFFGILHNFLFKIHIYSDQVTSVYNKVTHLDSTREYVVNLLKIASFAKVEQIIAPLWFLPVLFIVHLLFVGADAVITSFAPARRDLWLGAAVAALFTVGYWYYPDKNVVLRPVSIAMVVTSIFYFGHLFKRFGSGLALRPGYALLCFLLLAAASTYGAIDTGGHIFVSPFFYLTCSLCGVYLHLTLARSVPEGLIRKFLVHTGRNTITILALHFLAFRAVNYLLVRIHDLPVYMTGQHQKISTTGGWWLLYFAAGIALPLAVKAVYDRMRQAFARKSTVPTAA